MQKPDLDHPAWHKNGRTTSGGIRFYNADLDQVAIKYPSGMIAVYHDRLTGPREPYACYFDKHEIFEAEGGDK